MIDLLSTTQVILQEAGFHTWLTTADRLLVVCFEDDALMGFVCLFEEPAALIANWRALEMALLARYAARLRTAGDKAWNVYSVFLCGAAAEASQAWEIHWIEEDLERTRKIAASGLLSREDILKPLLPVLPLQYQPVLEREDVATRLNRRIRAIAPAAADAALDDNVTPTEAIRLLGAET
jgi:hypothetical protein